MIIDKASQCVAIEINMTFLSALHGSPLGRGDEYNMHLAGSVNSRHQP
jgi:hypothetical protein